MTASSTFPMTSHAKEKLVPEAQLRNQLTILHSQLLAHTDKMPGWQDINERARWAHEKDAITARIDQLQAQIRNRWQDTEVTHG